MCLIKLNNAVPHSSFKLMLRGIIIFMLMAVCSYSYGQTFYHFQYKITAANKNPVEYDILFTIGIGTVKTAAARIAFNDPVTGKKRLVKLNYVDNNFPDNSDSDKVTYFMPFGDAFDETDKPVKDFIMPWFQFNKPQVHTLSNAVVKAFINKQALPLVGSYEEKYMTGLIKDKAFLKRFYGEDELFYKSVFNINTPALNPSEKGRNLFMIIIAATADPKIGSTVLTDLQNMQSLVTNGQSLLGVNFKYTEISGKNFTKKAANDAIDKLKPGPQDIVIVYYSGHGFRYTDDVSPFPRMALVPSPDKNPATDNISVEDLYDRVKKKGAKVTIVLADCCNENYGASPPVGKIQPYMAAVPGTLTLNIDNWRALFLPVRRISLLACAADKNQLAGGNAHLGGFFTNYTVNEILTSLYGTPGLGEASWTRIINNSKEYTRRQAQTVECKEGACDVNGRSIQTPEMRLASENK